MSAESGQGQWLQGGRRAWTVPLALATLTLVVVAVKYGFSWHPEWRRLQDAAAHWPDLSSSPLIMEGDRSLLANTALAWLAGALGLSGVVSYFVFCGIATVLAIVLPFAMRARDGLFAMIAFVVVAGGAVAPTLTAWVGGYDAIVVIAATVAGLARNRWLAWLGWLVLGFSHSAVGGAAWLLWLPVMLLTLDAPASARLRHAGFSLAALVAGWLAIRWVTDAWGGSADRYSLFLAIDRGDILNAYIAGLPLVLFGALGIGWVLVLDARVRRLPASRALIAVALIAALGLPLIAVDETRVVVLSLVAATMAWLDHVVRHLHVDDPLSPSADLARARALWPTWATAAALVPVPVVWMGALLYPGWSSWAGWTHILQ